MIIVGNKDTLKLRSTSTNGATCRYHTIETIEDALSDTDDSDGCGNFERPPFIHLSCAGWANKPANCTETRGALVQ